NAVVTSVRAEEHGGHISGDTAGFQGIQIGGVEVAAGVHVAGDFGVHGADAENGDGHPLLQVQDAPDAAFLPHHVFRGGVVEERRYRELFHFCPVRRTEAANDLRGVGDAGGLGVAGAVELDNGAAVGGFTRQVATDGADCGAPCHTNHGVRVDEW